MGAQALEEALEEQRAWRQLFGSCLLAQMWYPVRCGRLAFQGESPDEVATCTHGNHLYCEIVHVSNENVPCRVHRDVNAEVELAIACTPKGPGTEGLTVATSIRRWLGLTIFKACFHIKRPGVTRGLPGPQRWRSGVPPSARAHPSPWTQTG